MMKRKMKISFSLLTAVILVLSLGAAALAEGASVSYEGGAEQFVFLPGSDYTDTDLFDGFKGVMPGDTVTQKITVTNRLSGSDTVKLYPVSYTHLDVYKRPVQAQGAKPSWSAVQAMSLEEIHAWFTTCGMN